MCFLKGQIKLQLQVLIVKLRATNMMHDNQIILGDDNAGLELLW